MQYYIECKISCPIASCRGKLLFLNIPWQQENTQDQLKKKMHSVSLPSSTVLEPAGTSRQELVRKNELVTQSCRTLCDPRDCSLPGSSVPGIF